MKASEWIDRVKEKRGWETDYRVSKELFVHRSTIGGYRTKIPTFDEETALKVAAALGISPAGLLVDQLAERTKDASLRTALLAEAARLCILCKVGAATKTIAARARPSRASASFH
jgi:transcriptional regulator with XRE-family HTH domain